MSGKPVEHPGEAIEIINETFDQIIVLALSRTGSEQVLAELMCLTGYQNLEDYKSWSRLSNCCISRKCL